MPDLINQPYYHCESCEHFSTKVKGSKGSEYTVAYGPTRGPYEYDYHCTCDSFKFGKGNYCKHIKEVKNSGLHCNWSQFLEGGEPNEVNGEKVCPRCGARVHSMLWAV